MTLLNAETQRSRDTQRVVVKSPHKVKKETLIHVLIYGLCGGVLIVVLKVIEFRFLVVEHAIEIYGGLIAVIFAGLGIWLGLKLTRKKEVLVVKEVPVPSSQPFALNGGV